MSAPQILALTVAVLVIGTLLVLLVWGRDVLVDFVRTITKFEFGPTGLKLERAITNAQVAEARRDVPSAERAARPAVEDALRQLGGGRSILWVDDHPDNNSAEVSVLANLGNTVIQVRSNSEAIEKLSGQTFDIVLSDIGRSATTEPPTAGLSLPDEAAAAGYPIERLVYYTGSAEGEKTPSGYDVTDRPLQLFAAIRKLTTGS